jgi:GAF domain-containing protein
VTDIADAIGAPSLDFHRTIAELMRAVATEPRPHYEPTVARFADLAVRYVDGVDAGGAVLVLGRTDWQPVSEPGTPAGIIEKRHIDLGDGPAMQAARDQQIVRIPDLATETRWPEFAASFAALPVRTMVCLPLYTHIHTWGGLMLLANRPEQLGREAEAAGAILATHIAMTLDALHQDRHYRSALGSRDIIGQAKGVLMERFGVDAVAAFALLTRLADESHRPVVVVAKDFLESKSGLGLENSRGQMPDHRGG